MTSPFGLAVRADGPPTADTSDNLDNSPVFWSKDMLTILSSSCNET